MLLLGMLGALIVVVVVGVVAAVSSSPPPERAVTISQEDRNAPVELRRAARAVGFEPLEQSGVGSIENQPAEAARPTLGKDLLEVGTKAPPFTLRTPAGRKVSLADYRGKAVLLEFFATWCPHCAAEAPHLRTLSRELPESKYAVVSVDGSNADPASVYAYHVYFGLPYPALVDPAPGEPAVTFPEHGTRGKVSKAYGVGYFPTFYVIDPQGRITWRADGEQPDELLKQQLRLASGA
jgi:peroxiredoxin